MKISIHTKKSKMYIICYALLFIVFFALFYIILLFQLKVENVLLKITNKLQENGVLIENTEIHWLSRQIEISKTTIQQKNTHIELANIRMKIHPIAKKLSFHMDIVQNNVQDKLVGELEGTIVFSKLFDPDVADTHLTFKKIHAKYIFDFFKNKQFQNVIEIVDGNISGSITLRTPISRNNVQIFASQGNLNLQINDTTATHIIPFFKESTITNLQGIIKLHWAKFRLNIDVAKIDCPLFQIEFMGVIDINKNQLWESRIDSHATVRVDLTKVHEKFVPKRTLKSLKQNGKVEMKIRNTLNSPRVNIQ